LPAEIDEAFTVGTSGTVIAPYDRMKTLPYLKACIDESLRLWPPTGAGLPRETPAGEATILSEHIPGGVIMSVPIFETHRDPTVWHHCEEFISERWLAEDAPVLMSRYFIPFSYGGRACIGRNISYLEQTMFLGTILHRYEFAFKDPAWEIERVEGLNTWPQAFPLKIWRREISDNA
jgi:cytochrome P450